MLNLTVQVLNLSLNASRSELETLFSYCGTVEMVRLQRNNDSSQSALVTFLQPFAYQTALLLNDVPVAGEPIRVLPSKETAADHTISDEYPIRDTEDNQLNRAATVYGKASSAVSAAAKETVRICTMVVKYDPVITAFLLLSIAIHRLANHAAEEWIKRRSLLMLNVK